MNAFCVVEYSRPPTSAILVVIKCKAFGWPYRVNIVCAEYAHHHRSVVVQIIGSRIEDWQADSRKQRI
ncbi:hypothetical protein TcasGA2_TC016038 [Tribolium castaneum]|uniref:Uncharacterized protein n=1 Tax=Tribolium castaneum TaxID=7070 RepID=D7EKL3_TRICA|nr:hypothetical protein TcasGA2_TC016038 [Tribolium castaneum]